MAVGPLIGRDHGVVLPVRVDPTGLTGPTKREAAGPEWRTSSRGLFVPASVARTPAQRVAEAGMLVSSRGGAVTGWAALAWSGCWWFTGTRGDKDTFLPIPVAMPRRLIRPQPLLHLCEERYDPEEVDIVDGLPMTALVRAVCFEMRYAANVGFATSWLDMAAFHDKVTIAEATAWAAVHPSYTGIEQCRQACALADENAWSPMEATLRIRWGNLGHPRPLTNRPVFDLNGRHIGTPDVIDPVTGVLGEYDGEIHLEGTRRALDLRREHVYREHGLEPVTMVAADTIDDGPFAARLRAAYARAELRPASDRLWTLERPPWWPATFTVSQRRRLSDYERERWLRNRVG